MSTVGIAGAGAWGTALACVAAADNRVVLWGRDPGHVQELAAARENRRHLPGIALPAAVEATADLAALTDVDAILLVTPAQATRDVAAALAAVVRPTVPLVLCAKGIEQASGLLQSEIVAETVPGATVAVLGGPTFANEVARGLPTAVTLACRDETMAERLVHLIGTATFRPYASPDVIGAQVCGALKNVIAIACGIVEGRGLGLNARAALIARGIAEMARFATALGASERTLLGLSGIGDLTLTCTSAQSRNYRHGLTIGVGDIDPGALTNDVVEGVQSGPGVLARAASFGLDMPISAAVTAILHDGADIAETIAGLLNRPFRHEHADR